MLRSETWSFLSFVIFALLLEPELAKAWLRCAPLFSDDRFHWRHLFTLFIGVSRDDARGVVRGLVHCARRPSWGVWEEALRKEFPYGPLPPLHHESPDDLPSDHDSILQQCSWTWHNPMAPPLIYWPRRMLLLLALMQPSLPGDQSTFALCIRQLHDMPRTAIMANALSEEHLLAILFLRGHLAPHSSISFNCFDQIAARGPNTNQHTPRFNRDTFADDLEYWESLAICLIDAGPI